MQLEEAPPVVAVVVAFDPGPWFEECLEALGAQDYPNLSILVVDAGSATSPAPRVAAVLPKAYFRASSAGSYGAAANEVLSAVKGATHLLLCHDDVAPAPDAVRRMVEEAFRSNAGIVSPKLVAWHEPDRLLQVGLGADLFGCPVPRVEPGEIDQAQHDEVREVFAAPGGCTLVRADLFEALGGYDPDITMLGEDLDLGWRAQVAGARVVVAPSAAVRHLEATAGGVRERPDKRLLQRRHELRAVLKNYGLAYRAVIVPQMALLAILEIAYCIGVDDRARAREVLAAWRWNVGHHRSLRAARRRVRKSRRLPDHVVSRLRSPARRVRSFVSARTRPEAVPRAGADIGGRPERRLVALLHPGRRAEALAGAGLLALVVVFGVRGLFTASLPLVGGLAPMPSPTSLLASFFGGWTGGGVQLNGPAPPAFGLLGFGGILLAGSSGVLQKVVLLGSIGAGALGAGRMLAPFSSPRARTVAAAAYVALPLLWNDLARGDLRAVVAFGAMPYVLSRLARATRTPPLARSRGLPAETASLGLLLAVAGSLVPTIVLLAGATALATAFGLLLTGEQRAIGRTLLVGLGGCAAALLLTFPWSAAFFSGGAAWSHLLGALGAPAATPSLAALLRFGVGPVGRGLLGWGLLAAATVPLVVARAERFRVATRWWCTALAAFAIAWAGVQGWLGNGGGDTGVLLAPAAAALAGSVALGVTAFEVDLPSYRFGWRQALTAAGAACALAGALPFLGATFGGRASLPSVGYEQTLGYLSGGRGDPTPYRVLWLGDPGAVPLRGWSLGRGYVLAVSDGGLPDATAAWPPVSDLVARRIEADVALARSGLTVNVGTLLTRYGIRFVVVPASAAPQVPGVQTAKPLPPPPGLLDGLSLQTDLRQVPTQAGSTVFVNADWSPDPPSGARPGASLPGAARPPLAALASGGAAAIEMVLFLGALVLALRRPRRRPRRRGAHARGATGAGTTVQPDADPPSTPDSEPEQGPSLAEDPEPAPASPPPETVGVGEGQP